MKSFGPLAQPDSADQASKASDVFRNATWLKKQFGIEQSVALLCTWIDAPAPCATRGKRMHDTTEHAASRRRYQQEARAIFEMFGGRVVTEADGLVAASWGPTARPTQQLQPVHLAASCLARIAARDVAVQTVVQTIGGSDCLDSDRLLKTIRRIRETGAPAFHPRSENTGTKPSSPDGPTNMRPDRHAATGTHKPVRGRMGIIESMTHRLTGSDRMLVLRGRIGSGLTTVANSAADCWRAAGGVVIPIGPTSEIDCAVDSNDRMFGFIKSLALQLLELASREQGRHRRSDILKWIADLLGPDDAVPLVRLLLASRDENWIHARLNTADIVDRLTIIAATIAQDEKLLFVVEDEQRLEPRELEFLAAFFKSALRAADARVLITTRDFDGSGIAGDCRHETVILPVLEPDDIAALCRDRGIENPAPIVAASGGNPLIAVELCSRLAAAPDADDPHDDDQTCPLASVIATLPFLHRELDRLGHMQAALKLLSVFDRPFQIRDASHLFAMDAKSAATTLSHFVRQGLLSRSPSADGTRFTFPDDMVRSGIFATNPEPLRTRLEGLAAAARAATVDAQPNGRFAAYDCRAAAGHFARSGYPDDAARWSIRAGGLFARDHRLNDAASAFEAALLHDAQRRRSRRKGSTDQGIDPVAVRLAIAGQRARHTGAGDVTVLEHYRYCLNALRERGSSPQPALEAAQLGLIDGHVAHNAVRSAIRLRTNWDKTAGACPQSARRTAADAEIAFVSGPLANAITANDCAAARLQEDYLADPGGDSARTNHVRRQLRLLGQRAILETLSGDPTAGGRTADTAVSCAEANAPPDVFAEVLLLAAEQAVWSRQPAIASALCMAAQAIANNHELPVLLATAGLVAGWCRCRTNLHSGFDDMTAAIGRLEGAGALQQATIARYLLADAAVSARNFALARTHLSRALASSQSIPDYRHEAEFLRLDVEAAVGANGRPTDGDTGRLVRARNAARRSGAILHCDAIAQTAKRLAITLP